MITVKYMLSYFASPMKLFGKIGLWAGMVALVSGLGTIGMKIFGGVDMTGNPLLLLTILSVVTSIQFLSLGLLGEVSARIYYGSQSKQHYAVRERLNFDESQPDNPEVKRAA
ncbi:MAG: hypothetical protein IH987_08020 [Planctomycetes bacterium]|nr:hypothetical protein [Planctomycetota bacterium]